MERVFVAIGGGELRTKSTLPIDKAIADIAKQRAGQRRANALFLPTASHDSLPYFNTFRKTYTSELGLKADVALLTKKDVPLAKNAAKIASADLIYLGGGDTLHLIDVLQATGADRMLIEAYNRGAVLCGLSAGAICWFSRMYSDADITAGNGNEYSLYNGMGLIDGLVCPHYNHRQQDFDALVGKDSLSAYAIEDDAAILFYNESPVLALTAGGKSYLLHATPNRLQKQPFAET